MSFLEELEQKRLNALLAARFLERITFFQFTDCTIPEPDTWLHPSMSYNYCVIDISDN